MIKYPVIDESNQQLIIETLRSIAELLIWGDQNETRFFEYACAIVGLLAAAISQKANEGRAPPGAAGDDGHGGDSFFFEKNIHSFFLKILNQKTSSTITVQLLQTLSILFENIQTETSICTSRLPAMNPVFSRRGACRIDHGSLRPPSPFCTPPRRLPLVEQLCEPNHLPQV